MSNPSPPTFNYSNLPFTVALIGNQFIFTFTIPTKPGLQLSNPIYVNAVELTVQKDRFNSNLVALGDDKGVYTVNYLNQVPPAGSLNAFINALLALIPVPIPPVVYTLANAGAGLTLVANGVGPNFTLNSISAGTDISVTLVGNDYVIASTAAPFAPPSPAFIAKHTPSELEDYLAASYVAVDWDNVLQNSTDVTYNAGTFIFTVVTTGDYLVTFTIQTSPLQGNYKAVVRDETGSTNLFSSMSTINSGSAAQTYGGEPGTEYDWTDNGTQARITQVINFTAADTFSLGVESDPAQTTVFTFLNDGVPSYGVDETALTACSIKRLL